jgi:hypothetical protein
MPLNLAARRAPPGQTRAGRQTGLGRRHALAYPADLRLMVPVPRGADLPHAAGRAHGSQESTVLRGAGYVASGGGI